VSRRTTSLVGVLGAAVAATVLAGCGSGSSSSVADPPSSTSPTSPSSPTSSDTAPAVDPASGRRVDLLAFTARTPHGFDYDNSLAKEIVFSSSRDLDQNLEYSDVTIYPGTSNAFAARLSVKNSSWHPKPRIADPVTIDGAEFYHLTGPVGEGVRLDEYGSVQGARLVKLSFELTGPASQRRKLVDSVLATVHLK
jgi:hypothetical protein